MKKILTGLMAAVLLLTFGAFAIASGDSEGETVSQGTDSNTAVSAETNDRALGKYEVEIKSCRLAEDYEGKPVVIVTYGFSNISNDTATSFMLAISDAVYQDGVGLNKSFVLSDDANYSSDNQSKEIKKGASIDVEVAYDLNDSTTDIEVEVKEFISLDDKALTKTFSIS